MSQALEMFPQITGTQIISTIENMAGLGSIGRQVLSDLGIYKIDPEKTILSISDEGCTTQYWKGMGLKRYRRLEEILKANCTSSAEEITTAMKFGFSTWQGTNALRDDVTAVVFRL